MNRLSGVALSLLLLLPATTVVAAASREQEILAKAAEAFTEIRKVPDAEIPDRLLSECRCVAVFPGVIKGAIGWGARHGHGVMSCRDSSGVWSAPSFMTITGGSFGLQLGVEKTDLVLFVMNERSARSLLESEFTLGAKGSVAAGPAGRSAEGATDIKLDAEIYSYARAKGLFAGISLEGARVNADKKANRSFYGRDLTGAQIVLGHAVSDTASTGTFLHVLPR